MISISKSIEPSTSYDDHEGDDALKIFDCLRIDDTRIPELCARAGQPSPYLILQEYLKRHATLGDTTIRLKTTRLKHQRHEFQMTVGEQCVRVICSNKREGKQKAAQMMIKRCK